MHAHRVTLILLLASACARVQPRTTEPAASLPASAAPQPLASPAEATRSASGQECMVEHTGNPEERRATDSRAVRGIACDAHGGGGSRTGERDLEDGPSATPPADALRTASGLSYVVLTPGTGTEHPGPGAHIRAHYIGWTASDLAMFDNSYERGEPIDFQAEHVIQGWGEAVPRMVVGETTRWWIPEALAYQGQPNLPTGMLIFDIELVSFTPGS